MQIKKIAAVIMVSATASFIGGNALADHHGDKKAMPTSVVTGGKAKIESFDWGSLTTYYAGESFGTTDGLWAVAEIKPGQEIHPPHEHEEEEFLMILEGSGTWHVSGKDFAAKAGDTMYSRPWDIHGIRNTGDVPLKFVVWKWNNKGIEVPVNPEIK